jgi:hypothetical protein
MATTVATTAKTCCMQKLDLLCSNIESTAVSIQQFITPDDDHMIVETYSGQYSF